MDNLTGEYTPEQLALLAYTMRTLANSPNVSPKTARQLETILNHFPTEFGGNPGGKRKFYTETDINTGKVKLYQASTEGGGGIFSSGLVGRDLRVGNRDLFEIKLNKDARVALREAFGNYQALGPGANVGRNSDGSFSVEIDHAAIADSEAALSPVFETPPTPPDPFEAERLRQQQRARVASDLDLYFLNLAEQAGYINSDEELELSLAEIQQSTDALLEANNIDREQYLENADLQRRFNRELLDESVADIAFELGQTEFANQFRANQDISQIEGDAAAATARRDFNAREQLGDISRQLSSTINAITDRASRQGQSLNVFLARNPSVISDSIREQARLAYRAELEEASQGATNQRRGVERQRAFDQRLADEAAQRAVDAVVDRREFLDQQAQDSAARDAGRAQSRFDRREEEIQTDQRQFLQSSYLERGNIVQQGFDQTNRAVTANNEGRIDDAQIRFDAELDRAAAENPDASASQLIAIVEQQLGGNPLRDAYQRQVDHRTSLAQPQVGVGREAPPTARVSAPSASLPPLSTAPGTQRSVSYSQGTTSAERQLADRDRLLLSQGYTDAQIQSDPQYQELIKAAQAQRRSRKQRIDPKVGRV